MPDGSPERFDAGVTGTDMEEQKGFCDDITKYKISGLMKGDIVTVIAGF
jgi:hypothetical protein